MRMLPDEPDDVEKRRRKNAKGGNPRDKKSRCLIDRTAWDFGKELKITFVKCPACAEEIEFFSDEIARKCPKCKIEVLKEKVPTCIDWCKAAKQCVGENLWKELGYDKLKEKRGKD